MIEPTVGAPAISSEPDTAPAVHAAIADPAVADAVAAEAVGPVCTQAQLRRFIKSRPYVPIHELRRRFTLGGDDDDVTGFDSAGRHVFVGLPAREARMLGDLVLQGDVGYELSLDPTSPIIVGVFPVRPVQRS
jgi:hypothetical protein